MRQVRRFEGIVGSSARVRMMRFASTQTPPDKATSRRPVLGDPWPGVSQSQRIGDPGSLPHRSPFSKRIPCAPILCSPAHWARLIGQAH